MSSEHIISHIADTTSLQKNSVRSVVSLLNEGATIPFIARYRKERTGSLDEVQIGNIASAFKKMKELEARKETILNAIEEQGKLNESLKSKIENTYDLNVLEDLYLPYKKKRKTKAAVAREAGLEPFAKLIFKQQAGDIFKKARQYTSANFTSSEAVIQGAQHIIAEWISEDSKLREKVRATMTEHGRIICKVISKKKDEAQKFKDYFDYEERLSRCPSHRFLAILRGQDLGLLRVKLSIDDERFLHNIYRHYVSSHLGGARTLKEAIDDGYKRLILPSIETQVKNHYKLKADTASIDVFRKNLSQLLLAPPLGQKVTLAIDPGFRTGCKVVVLDDQGNLMDNTSIFPHPPQSRFQDALNALHGLILKHKVQAIAVGDGTAGRETESLAKALNLDIPIYMVNEDGASIFSASELGRKEFPDLDVTVRGAISIGRRLMDPLAELVKIDAKSIGVGQYQHDVNQTMLNECLEETVNTCVNKVGVNLNTATSHILTFISGLGPVLAKNIIEYRKQNGEFNNITDLKKVPRLGARAFEQAAGFLRIRNGKNILDNTGVHPESYPIVKEMAKTAGESVEMLVQDSSKLKSIRLSDFVNNKVGMPTLLDILKELEKPGLDPRGEVVTFSFDHCVKDINDLKEGMILPGLITNITNFGAFVNIGIKSDGLIHISQIVNRFISNPADVLSLNQQVTVKVLDIDMNRGRINLSMKDI